MSNEEKWTLLDSIRVVVDRVGTHKTVPSSTGDGVPSLGDGPRFVKQRLGPLVPQ